uniref:Complex III subunit VI n=1 Tax=Salix viminalis TaxID=40686 RepID=A0A6N2NGB8_SALVM
MVLGVPIHGVLNCHLISPPSQLTPVHCNPRLTKKKSPVCLTELFSSNIYPKKYLEETCKPKCVRPLLEYQACVKRIQDDESGHKHCTGQYFDYWSCVDKCVAPKLFSKLK